MISMHPSFLLTLIFLVGLNHASAQFNFFENMFGHQQHQQQQQRSAASQWAAYSDSVSCSQYLCPETLDCVAKPVDCPCPNPEDIKCIVPDVESDVDGATIICTRGHNECIEVEKLMRKGVKPNKK